MSVGNSQASKQVHCVYWKFEANLQSSEVGPGMRPSEDVGEVIDRVYEGIEDDLDADAEYHEYGEDGGFLLEGEVVLINEPLQTKLDGDHDGEYNKHNVDVEFGG